MSRDDSGTWADTLRGRRGSCAVARTGATGVGQEVFFFRCGGFGVTRQAVDNSTTVYVLQLLVVELGDGFFVDLEVLGDLLFHNGVFKKNERLGFAVARAGATGIGDQVFLFRGSGFGVTAGAGDRATGDITQLLVVQLGDGFLVEGQVF